MASSLTSDEGIIASGSWPLSLLNRADAMSNFNLAGPSCAAGDGCKSGCPVPDPDCAKGLTGCPGQKDPAIDDAFWTAIKASDPVGPTWGPPDGLSRYPVVSRINWNEAVAARIEVPALVINGLKDSVVAANLSRALWSALPDHQPLVQLDCASHALMWETCSGDGCVDPHRTVQKLVGDWILIVK